MDDLRTLGRESLDETFSSLAGNLYRAFYANPANFTRTTFERGPIPSAVVGEGAGPIREAVLSMEKDLRLAVTRISGLLTRSTKEYPWPKSIGRFGDALSVTDAYVAWFSKAVDEQPISGPLKAAAQTEIQSEYAKYRPKLLTMAQGLDESQHLAEALNAFEGGLQIGRAHV